MTGSPARCWRLIRTGVLMLLTPSAVVHGAAPLAAAQAVTATAGAVAGVATDRTDAALPGVAISLDGPTLMSARTATTDDTGTFGISAVPPGDYTLTASLAGFHSVMLASVRVGLGATASVRVQLTASPLTITDTVEVTSLIDEMSGGVTSHFDSAKLASLPGSRDVFAILANTPGVAMAKMDVGGNGAMAIQEYTAYGLRATTGMHRNEVEGIRVGGANGANDNYLSDYASFSEIAITAAGHSAAMPVPGTMVRYVSKSGGNAYRGSVSADYQNGAWQATNIDDAQIARGVAGGPGLDARAVNQLQRFRDLNADVGGYLKRDRLWWYAAYRDSDVAQRLPWLLDAAAQMRAMVATAKVTYRASPRQSLIGYVQRSMFEQPNFFTAGISQPVQASDALPSLDFPVTVWKGEYNGALTDALFIEGRAGGYHSDARQAWKSTAPRATDIGLTTARGGALAFDRLIDRPQFNGTLSYMKSGWGGTHTFRGGGEYMADRVDSVNRGYGDACNCLSILNNGVPAQVQILAGSNVSENDLRTAAAFVDDNWRIAQRVTLSLGLRLDRYQPRLPEQEGPAGQRFPAVTPVTFTNWGPRTGASIDITGKGKTVLKLYYGRFWLYPSPLFSSSFNPNPPGWSRTYVWRQDTNRSGSWDAGEEGALIAVAGGNASTRLDPAIANTRVHQATAYLEHEWPGAVAVRTGVAMNGRRDASGTINQSRPLTAYSVPTAATDPGPDGRIGTADDGAALTMYALTADALATAPVNLTTNLPGSDSDYYTWELTASKRMRARWSWLASVAHTWHAEAALGPGSEFTPNALINTSGGLLRFTTWQVKVHGALTLPRQFRLIPVLRMQSGTPFSRTFVQALNYGPAVVRADPITANRTPDITIVDLRTEKTFRLAGRRLTGYFDVYNAFNTNAAQVLTTASGAAWLRPTVITGPRIVRIGTRLEW